MGSMFSLIDIMILLCGVYILYVFYQLKYKGVITENMLLPKGTSIAKCKDKQAYIAEMSPKVLAYGLLVTICGALGLLDDTYKIMGNFYYVILVVFLAGTVWFGVMTKKLLKKYW
ncbi:MAG: hypothetical protein Q4C50_08175 [Eubacteriales bacterium]|nr:hypothetical protein [Eubacteriales bacterium]